MTEFWKRFWPGAVSLGTLVALYIGAEAEGVLWAFWLTVAGAAVISAVQLLLPRSLTWATKVREYQQLLDTAARLQTENEQLRNGRSEVIGQAEQQWREGLAEGAAHVLGSLLAQGLEEWPVLVGVQTLEGQPVLLARWSRPESILGARFDLEVTATGAVRGVVEVRSADEERKLVSLVCVRPTAPKFWSHLAERAEVETEPPKGVALRPSSEDLPQIEPPPAIVEGAA